MYFTKYKINSYELFLTASDDCLLSVEFIQTENTFNMFNMTCTQNSVLSMAIQQLDEYFAGSRQTFHLPLQLHGTAFQRNVWHELINIPYGSTATYKELAERMGKPKAFRAVGNACNKNPFPIIIPCHRVIGSSGSMTGYAGGIELKNFLLNLEQTKNRRTC